MENIQIAFLEEEWDDAEVSFCTTSASVHTAEVSFLEEEWDDAEVSFCTTSASVHTAEVTEAD